MILLIFAIGWNYVCCLVALTLDDFRFFLLMLKVAWSFQVLIVLSFVGHSDLDPRHLEHPCILGLRINIKFDFHSAHDLIEVT